jgi:hypothetical protein
MNSIERPVQLYERVTVSGEGFRIEDAASVAMKNCLNAGVSGRGLGWSKIFFALPLEVKPVTQDHGGLA